MLIKPALISFFGLNIQGDFGGLTCYRSARQPFVWFEATSPKVPASIAQAMQRAKWTAVARAWSGLPTATRAEWRAAAAATRLNISAYNLWIHVATTGDLLILDTLNRQAGTNLQLQSGT